MIYEYQTAGQQYLIQRGLLYTTIKNTYSGEQSPLM